VRTDAQADAEFFPQLTMQSLGIVLTRLALSSGELPPSGMAGIRTALADQHATAALDQRSHHDLQLFGVVGHQSLGKHR
jgi:hypothetical protein